MRSPPSDKSEVYGQASLVGAAYAIEIEDPAQLQAQSEEFCSPLCRKECGKCCGWELVIVVPLAVLAAIIAGASVAGGSALLVVAAIAPAAVILTLTEKFYRHAVTRCQMTVSFFEAILWMIPLIIWIVLYSSFIEGPLGVRDAGLCDVCILSYAFNAYIMAGWFEETLKYLCIIRLMNKPFVNDPRALLVYAVCAGAGFAAVENILYVSFGGFVVAIMRAFLSVPMHCAWAALTGMSLAENKFRERHDSTLVRYAKAVWLPTFLHGTYNFGLFVGSAAGTVGGNLAGLGAALMVLVVSLVLVRVRALDIARSFPRKNIHAQIQDGEAPIPCNMCAVWLPTCCMK